MIVVAHYFIKIILVFAATYPSSIPEMTFPDHLKTVGLHEHIRASLQDLAGSPMLIQLFSAAKEWIEGHPFSVNLTSVPAPATKVPPQRTVCSFYAKGKCKYGSKCKNYHPDGKPSPSKQGEVSSSSDVSSVPDQESDDFGAGKMEANQENGLKSDKKQSMRTATDVISRILWDSDLKTDEFAVGYLDRFVGIIEKPFNAFSWEDLSTLGNNVLAVPKHRIQYFKYRQEIVWDKREQLDNVFGSRGGKVIQDVVEGYNKDLESSKSDEAGTGEDTTQGFKPRNREDRPTHFICIRVTDKEILSNVRRIQSDILSHSPQLAEGCLPLTALHVTVCMVKLDTASHLETAIRVLEDTKKYFAHYLPRCAEIKFTGVDHFHDRLVYAKVAPNASLEKFSYFLIEHFKKAGLKTPGNHAQFTPHMTLVKLSRPMQHDQNTATISRDAYSQLTAMHIGKQVVDGIYLCSMTEAKQEDGFYKWYHSTSNSLLYISPLVPTVIAKCVYELEQSGVVLEMEGAELVRYTTNSASDASSFDKSLEKIQQLIPSACSPLKSRVIVLRGLPGSGKSYLANNCSEKAVAAICSADDYFTKSGIYEFKQEALPDAHLQCFETFLQALVDGKEVVIVDNTNSMAWEYRNYLYLCDLLKVKSHILEIPHPNQLITTYSARNLHKINMETLKSYTERWEEDKRAMLVPPKISYPQTTGPVKELSLVNLCQPGYLPKQVLVSSTSLVPVYTAVFFTPKSQWKLLSCITPTHPKTHADHSTLTFEPRLDELSSVDIGRKVSVTVQGLLDSSTIQAVTVSFPTGVSSQNKHPHITLSTEEGVSPKLANTMLLSQPTKPVSAQIKLNGVIGVVVKEDSDSQHNKPLSGITILSKNHFTETVLPRLVESLPTTKIPLGMEIEKPAQLESNVSICTGTQKITKLFVFDFDGTLFDTPDPGSGRQFYQECTGHMWPYTGWLSRPESLLPPLKIRPGPALSEYHQHYGIAGSYTVILTSRLVQTEVGVRTVLLDHQLSPDELILKPGDLRITSPEFKVRSLSQLLQRFPEVREVKFWDDRDDNLHGVRQFSKRPENAKITFDVVDSTTMTQSETDNTLGKSVLGSYLLSSGLIPTDVHARAAQTGIDFIASQFSTITGFEGIPSSISLVFGSHVLGRRSDVDLCLLTPPGYTHFECVEKLAEQLDKCGITQVHKGFSTRCPRLKVMLHFQDTPSIDYDIVFAVLPSQEAFTACVTNPKLLDSFLANDAVSKTSLSGWTLMGKVQDIVGDFVPLKMFGAVVEMTLQMLTAQRERGNFYHSFRSFHVVLLLADFIKSHHKAISDCDSLFCAFIERTAVLTAHEWQTVFEEYVYMAPEFIPHQTSVFQTLSKTIKQQEIPFITRYEDMMIRPVFPSFGHTPVCLLCSCGVSKGDQVLNWKLHTFLEAKLPAFLRQLVTCGMDVILDGNGFTQSCLCFAVQDTGAARKSLQSEFSKFWNDFSEYHGQKDFKLELRFSGRCDSDSAKADVRKQVEQFASSELSELHLPHTLNAYERRLVHETAEKLRISHKTVGEGANRHIYLHK